MRQNKRWTSLPRLAVTSSLLLLLSGCRSDSPSPPPSKTETPPAQTPPAQRQLVWGGPKNISMLAIIAERQGYFREVGLNVRPNYVQTGKIATDALVSGDLDFGIIVETNIAFIQFQQGANLSVVSSVMEKFDDAIVARSDQGVTEPKDLEGKRLAIVQGTTSHRFADLFIERHRLNRDRIEFVNLTPPAIQAGLLSGNLPAGSVWEPFRYNIEQALPGKVVQFKNDSIYRAYALLAVRKDFAAQEGNQIRAFIQALIRAEQFVREHKTEAVGILSQELAIPASTLNAVWNEYILTVRLDAALLQVLADEGAWISRSQQGFEGRPVPRYDNVLDPQFLRAVQADRLVGFVPPQTR